MQHYRPLHVSLNAEENVVLKFMPIFVIISTYFQQSVSKKAKAMANFPSLGAWLRWMALICLPVTQRLLESAGKLRSFDIQHLLCSFYI